MVFRQTAARWTILAAALVSVSCNRKDRTVADSGTASSTASTTASTTASSTPSDPRSTRPEQPAEIQLPATGTKTNLDSLRAYLDTFYHGALHPHELDAICADKASTGGCTARVTIQAIGLSKDIKPDSGPRRGRVIGEIKNLDPRNRTQLDSLLPSSRATYYVYLDRAASGHARWNLLEVPATPTGTIRKIAQHEVRGCGERPGYGWRHSDVDYSNCGDHALTDMVSASLLTATGLVRFAMRLDKYLRAISLPAIKWYGCSGGCCV